MNGALKSVLFFVACLLVGIPGKINAQEPILKVISTGGMCPYGACRTEVIIDLSGSYTWTEGQDGTGFKQLRGKGQIPSKEMQSLLKEIEMTDFEEIKSHKFVGTCPTAFDGPEKTYVFPKTEGEEVIPSCKYAIDKEPVIIYLNRLLTEICARPNQSVQPTPPR